MTELERATREYEKCFNDPYYFFKTYCTVTTTTKTETVKREVLTDGEFEEVVNIFLKYFTDDEIRWKYNRENIRLVERVTHEDGSVSFVLSFDGHKSSVDLEQVLPLFRKEKIEKICRHLSQV